MKKIIITICLLLVTNNVSAFSIETTYEDYYITFIDAANQKYTYQLDMLHSEGSFYYKTDLNETYVFNYSDIDTILKDENSINKVLYVSKDLIADDQLYYYATQYYIYTYIYTDYSDYYISDQDGNENTAFMDEYVQNLKTALKMKIFLHEEMDYNENTYLKAETNFSFEIISVNSNIKRLLYEDKIGITFLSGTTGKIYARSYINEDITLELYHNGGENYIMKDTPGEFFIDDDIRLNLITSDIGDNPNTGTSNIIYIFIIIPMTILIGILLYSYTKEQKKQHL